MNPVFQSDQFLLQRQVFALTGKLRFFLPTGDLALFCEQRMFKLREDIRVYEDEAKTREALAIKARQVIDFSASYDVFDSESGQKVGTLRRKGLKSLLRDEWEVLDSEERAIGLLFEDNMTLAILRRVALGNWLPQNYDLTLGETKVADLKQRFNLFRYEMDVDFSMDTQRQFDHRLGVAAATLLAIIEGRQES